MAQFYRMPAASPTMELGTLVSWRIQEGQKFDAPAVIAEVATDKANAEAEIFDSGVLLKQLVAEGAEIPVGYPLAIVGTKADEDISGLLAEFEQEKAKAAQPKAQAQEDQGGQAAVEEPPKPAEKAAPEPHEPVAKPAPAAPPAPPKERSWAGRPLPKLFMDPTGDIRAATAAPARIVASPLARAVAAERGLDLRRVKGSGPGGRVLRADVENATQLAPPGARAGGPLYALRSDETLKNSPMRKTIAKRLLASHKDIPNFFLTAVFDAQGFVDLRTALKARRPDAKVSYNDMLVLCVARALREFPKANASWSDEAIVRHGRVDIGIAVALEDGLITPVVRNADQKSLLDIADEIRALADRARAGKLKPDEYTGGTFTISNLGVYGIDEFTAIINPPEVAILAVGAVQQVPAVVDGAIRAAWRMKVTMTCDHRVIDGAVGAQFLQVLRGYVEAPALLLV